MIFEGPLLTGFNSQSCSVTPSAKMMMIPFCCSIDLQYAIVEKLSRILAFSSETLGGLDQTQTE